MRRFPSRSHQSGATIIEFALVASIFFLIMLAIFEFGRAFYVRNSSQHLTRCIAREAVVLPPTPAGAEQAKSACLMGGSWPFYDWNQSNVAGLFQVQYVTLGGGAPAVDQLNACMLGQSGCVTYVRVTTTADSGLVGLLRGWLGDYDAGAKEPTSETTMPAESMGHLR